METVMSGLCDEWPVLRTPKYRFPTLCAVSGIFFFLGLPQVTQVAMATNHLRYQREPFETCLKCYINHSDTSDYLKSSLAVII